MFRQNMKKYALALAALVGLTSTALADDESIAFNAPSVDWATFASTLVSYITGAILVAVGVGLGIWAFRLIYRMFKSFAK